jgi:hypothetical protein
MHQFRRLLTSTDWDIEPLQKRRVMFSHRTSYEPAHGFNQDSSAEEYEGLARGEAFVNRIGVVLYEQPVLVPQSLHV